MFLSINLKESAPIVIKYLMTSVFAYLYILSMIYAFVEFLRFDKVKAYVLVYISAYFLEYIITLRLVFKEPHRYIKVYKFIGYVICFLIISTFVYKLMLSIGINYLISAIITAGVLMPARFIVNKHWVYR